MSRRICVFGDSIVRGYYDHEMGGWAQRLQQFFMQEEEFSVYPLGISGDTTSDLLKRCAVELSARRPEFIIFAIGINDAARYRSEPCCSVGDFEHNIQKLYEIADSFDCTVIFVGLTRVTEVQSTPVSWDADISYYNNDIDMYDASIKKIAHEKKCLFVDMRDVLTDNDLEDGVHPDTDGHIKIYEKMMQFFVEHNIIKII